MKDLDDKMVKEEEQEEEWRGRAESYELDSFVCVTGYLSGIDILLFNISSLTSSNDLDVASFVNPNQVVPGNFWTVWIRRRIRPFFTYYRIFL